MDEGELNTDKKVERVANSCEPMDGSPRMNRFKRPLEVGGGELLKTSPSIKLVMLTIEIGGGEFHHREGGNPV